MTADKEKNVQPIVLDSNKEPEVFEDVFTKSHMSVIFQQKKNQFSEVKSKVVEFIELFEDKVNRSHEATRKSREKEETFDYNQKMAKVIKVLRRGKIYSQEEEARDYGAKFVSKTSELLSVAKSGTNSRRKLE